jgi:hypothetical protein
MFNANAVSNALTLANTVQDDEQTSYYYTCNEQVTCGGETLWGYTQAGEVLTVTGIAVHVREDYCDVNVTLAEERVVYTDAVFAQAVSALLNMQVDYTEQGMQDYGHVSMET